MEQVKDLKYSIRVSNADKLNLADFQNSIPLIRDLAVANDSERKLISEQMEEEFELVVDIRRARMQRIKPLASAESQVNSLSGESLIEATVTTFDDGAPDLPDDGNLLADGAELDPKDRLGGEADVAKDLSLMVGIRELKAEIGKMEAWRRRCGEPSW